MYVYIEYGYGVYVLITDRTRCGNHDSCIYHLAFSVILCFED